MYEESRKRLKTATDGSLVIRNEHDRLFVSNSRATEFVSRWADVQKLDSKVQQLDKEVDALMAEKEEAKREREVRQERDIRFDKLYQEKFNSEEAIRQRFFGDVLVIPSEKDHPWIRRGNVDAHHGDCVRDANLYEAGSRNDPHIFQTLYGFAPSAVLNMDRKFSSPGPQ